MAEMRKAPRVLRRGEQPTNAGPEFPDPVPEEAAPAPAPVQKRKAPMPVDNDLATFEGTFSSGRKIVLREMTAADLLYLEKSLGNLGDMERSLKLATRLSTGDGKVTFEDLQRLKMKDLRVVTDLLAQAGETGDEDDDEFDPNE